MNTRLLTVALLTAATSIALPAQNFRLKAEATEIQAEATEIQAEATEIQAEATEIQGEARGIAQDADIAGIWQVNITTGQAQGRSAPLALRREDQKIVGTMSTPQGDQAVDATVSGKAVTLWFSAKTQTGLTKVTMKGTVDADVMNGTIDFGSGQGQWTAKRGAAGAAATQSGETRTDVSGTWAFQVEFSGGSGTPTMTFKQDGEKLTGHYSGQLGEAPLAGTIKGNTIEFVIDIDVQGTAAHIVYTGTVEKDTMKGAVTLGEFGEGTFTAKKKP